MKPRHEPATAPETSAAFEVNKRSSLVESFSCGKQTSSELGTGKMPAFH